MIGAYWDDDNGADSGSVYIFQRAGEGWAQIAHVLASDGVQGDWLGRAVAVDGERALAGALQHVHRTGNGSVYAINRDGVQWSESQELYARDGELGDGFARTVAIDGGWAIVGASGKQAAYAFRFDEVSGQWLHHQVLVPDGGAPNDAFGLAVAISGSLALIGAPGHDPVCSGSPANDAGAAYVFRLDASEAEWVEEQRLIASDCQPSDAFGGAVSIHGGACLVGADKANAFTGAAYAFRYDVDSGMWFEEQKLTASDGQPTVRFGTATSIDGDTALIGAPFDDEAGDSHGAAYVFRRIDSEWVEQEKLLSDPLPWTAFFGFSVGMQGDRAIVSAFGEDQQRGAAYIFDGLAGADCNLNGIADTCDLLEGTSSDLDANGIPDECDCPWDLDSNGSVDTGDVPALLAAWGTNPGGPPDFDGGGVGTSDLLTLLSSWGPCP